MIKVVIAGPPNCGKAEFMSALATRFRHSVLRDYKIGRMDVLRLDYTSNPNDSGGTAVEIMVHALVGQAGHESMYEILLSNAAAVLMMVDINPARMPESLQVMIKSLDCVKKRGLDAKTIPMVLQYHHAERANQQLVAQWDQLLELEHNRIPRFFSASNFAEGSFTGYDLLLRETIRLMLARQSA